MTRCFEVMLTSFSSDKCHGQFKFKIKWLFVTSANELVRAFKCSKQILSRELSPIGVLLRMKTKGFRGLDSQAFPGISLKRATASEARCLNYVATFHVCTNGGGSMFFSSLMEMKSSVADIICIAKNT